MVPEKKTLGTGVVIAVITPLKGDGSVDEEGLAAVINHCVSGGVHGIFVLGTTGSGPCLRNRDKAAVIETARKATPGHIPFYIGASDTSTSRVKDNISIAQDNGADVAVVTAPYYLTSKTQDEIVRHMDLCAQYASIPLMAYNIPWYVGVQIALPTVRRIVQLDNIIGLKDSEGDWEQFQKEIYLKEELGFKLLLGAEDVFGAGMLMGADGCVSGIGNYLPKLVVRMYEAAVARDAEKVRGLQARAARLRVANSVGEMWLATTTYICSLYGLCEEHMCEPFSPLTEAQKEQVRSILAAEDALPVR